MQTQIEKIVYGVTVDGVTYERNYKSTPCSSCEGCVAFIKEEATTLCDALVEDDCCHSYIFKIKDITKNNYTNVNPLAKSYCPPFPPAPTQKTSGAHQGVKTDTGKPRFTLIPPFALEEMAICLTEGLISHPDKDNWKLVENGKERFLDSLYRHWNQYQMGEVFDRDNPNVRNLAAIMVNAAFALEFEVNPELNGTKEKTND